VASYLPAALTAIATAWEALTPTHRVERPYRRVTSQHRVPDGTSGVNVFWFELPSTTAIVGLSSLSATLDYEVIARCRLTLAGVSIGDRPTVVADRVTQLMGAANRVVPPTGVRSIRCTGAGPHELLVDVDDDGNEIAAGDLDVIFAFTIRTEETD
jgi:hypothetical protein